MLTIALMLILVDITISKLKIQLYNMNCDQLAICNTRLEKSSLWLWLLPLHWIGPREVLVLAVHGVTKLSSFYWSFGSASLVFTLSKRDSGALIKDLLK